MLLKKKSASVLCSLTLGFGLLFTGCSGDDNKVTEPVTTAVTTPSDAHNMQEPAEVVHFGFDVSQINAAAEAQVQKVAEYLRAKPGTHVQVEGHCDERGTVEYNLALGNRRATAVRDYLVNLGVDAGTVSTISYGKEKMADTAHNEEAHAKNRRAEFKFNSK